MEICHAHFEHSLRRTITACDSLLKFFRRGPAFQYQFSVRPKDPVPPTIALPIATDDEQEIWYHAGHLRPTQGANLPQNMFLFVPSLLLNSPSTLSNSDGSDFSIV